MTKEKKLDGALPYQDFVMGTLELSKMLLQKDGQLLPVAMALVASPGAKPKIEVCGLVFTTNEEKYAAYQDLWDRWLPKNPKVMCTVADAYSITGKDTAQYAGSLEAMFEAGDPRVTEVITITVLPRGQHMWGVAVPYKRLPGGGFQFMEPEINANENGTDLSGGLLPEQWTRQADRTTFKK